MRKIQLLAFAACFSAAGTQAQDYKNPKLPIETRINDLVSKMTVEEKIAQLYGDGLRTKPNERLGIPGFEMSDGPIGVRTGKATAFPAGVALATSWDTSLVARVAKAIAVEAKAKGINMMLGPTVNIHRFPIGGRNFESYSEDPYLASRMAVAYIKAMQNENVIASVKHFCCNDQEWERMRYDAVIDERTLHEIHLPAFKAAIQEAGSLTIMSAYNKINGLYASENTYLLNDVLKKNWGFKGLVVSDWEATHSTVPSAKAGLDLEMPTGVYFSDSLLAAVKAGKVTKAEIDEKVKRVLYVKFKAGLFDTKPSLDESKVNSKNHQALALEAAQKGMVLLKNKNNFLPMDKNAKKTIAIIGPNANIARTGAGGSSQVNSYYAVSPLEAIKEKTGGNAKINFSQGDVIDIKGITIIDSKYLVNDKGEQGLNASYWDKPGLEDVIAYNISTAPTATRTDKKIDFIYNDPESPDAKIDKDYWVARWTGKLKPPISRKYKIYTQTDDGIRVYFEGKKVIDNWDVHGPEKDSFEVDLEGFKTYDIKIEYFEGNMGAMMKLGWDLPEDGATAGGGDLISEAVKAAKSADIAIVFAGMSNQYESEGFDTKTGLKLPSKQDSLVMAVSKANPNTIVCLTNGNGLAMPWINEAAAVIEGWYSGQEVGNAFANIIYGDYNPSGKLTSTLIKKESDSPTFNGYKDASLKVPYSEGIFVGYRYYDKNKTEVAFPFGYGLSYTTFEYSNIKVADKGANIEVSFTVKNTGKRNGEEVTQLYVKNPVSELERAEKELKGFAKTALAAGESKNITISINKNTSFSYYDVKTKSSILKNGNYTILVGGSSQNLPLKAEYVVK